MKTMIFKLEMYRTYFYQCILHINIKITIGEKEVEVRPLDRVASKAQELLDWRHTKINAAGQINRSSGVLQRWSARIRPVLVACPSIELRTRWTPEVGNNTRNYKEHSISITNIMRSIRQTELRNTSSTSKVWRL